MFPTDTIVMIQIQIIVENVSFSFFLSFFVGLYNRGVLLLLLFCRTLVVGEQFHLFAARSSHFSR